MKKEIEPYYQREAKRIVDTMFDSKVFRDDMSRDDIQSIEDLFAFYLQSTAESSRRSTEIMMSLRKK